MSDRMTPIPFSSLLNTLRSEYGASGTLFGVTPSWRGEPSKQLSLFGENLEVPLGPAAGPHTQLAQNIIAAYVGGARFFELKTVQTLDGEDLPVAKPCILAEDEGYNVEWSTELTVPQAMEEYIKAWYALKILSKELGLGDPNGFIFNMSVGYDLAGISSEKIDTFLEGLRDASGTQAWRACADAARQALPCLHNVDQAYLDSISPHVSRSVTLSTLHGCPPDEIERIASYLLEKKGLHTFVKCNPTLLGYEFARSTLDEMGYSYLQFDERHFREDLQFADAVPMLTRLQKLADARGLTFGVKLTNTFPVDIDAGQLPGEEMYMSGKSLAPLSLALAEKLSRAFGGKLRISYSGGADAFNVADIYDAGVWPITCATTLLKPGGYRRLRQMAKLLSTRTYAPFSGTDTGKLAALAARVKADPHHRKPRKPIPNRKNGQSVPLLDCFLAPCKEGCPFGQDIPEYIRLLGQGLPGRALTVILEKNPLPNITGTICSHHCAPLCTRNFYDSPVEIRQAKLAAAQAGWTQALDRMECAPLLPGIKVAVVGGGPAGMAAAYLLARRGAAVTLFEQRESLGGVVRHVIPAFRIGDDAIDKDASLLARVGVDVRLNAPAPGPQALRADGYTHVLLAVGAWAPAQLELEGKPPLRALDFLENAKKHPDILPPVRHVVVVGGGNTAMDTARAARRLPGAPEVTIAYRRTARYMPAEEEELELALADGVIFRELLSPTAWDGASLTCDVLRLGKPDAGGRRAPEKTGQAIILPADLVIAAVGDGIDGAALSEYGVLFSGDGKPVVSSATLESGVRGVYVIGDARRGGASIAHAIADAHRAVNAILGEGAPFPLPAGRRGEALEKKGVLCPPGDPQRAGERCLECSTVCENCVDVCPNRANLSITVPTRRMPQIVHLDALCNECGNCAAFCPYASAPYRDKFTLFASVADFNASTSPGFVVLDRADRTVRVRLDGLVVDACLRYESTPLPSGIQELLETIFIDYPYLLSLI